MKQRELEIQQAKLREQRLLKTAARSRALRQSRKDHASSPEKNEGEKAPEALSIKGKNATFPS